VRGALGGGWPTKVESPFEQKRRRRLRRSKGENPFERRGSIDFPEETLKDHPVGIREENHRKDHREEGSGSGPQGEREKTLEAIGNPIRGQTTKGPLSKGPKVADSHSG
jgi:hypothetical protein